MQIKYATEEEIRSRAFILWKNRSECWGDQQAHGFDKHDWDVAQHQLFIDKNYRLYAREKFEKDRSKGSKVLFQSEDPNCRYCKKTKADGVKFGSKQSHLIPQCLGNDSLFSFDECSECNDHFGHCDSSLANSISLIRTLGHFRKKGGGTPTYKTNSGIRVDSDQLIIRVTGPELKLASELQEPFMRIDPQTNSVIFDDSNKTNPTMNFKALCKTGLALVAPKDLKVFPETIKWIRNDDHSIKPKGCEELAAHFTTIDSAKLEHHGDISLYIRKETETQLPGALLMIRTGKMAFQIAIPRSGLDEHFIGRIDVPYIPPFEQFNPIAGAPKWTSLPMNAHVDVSCLNCVKMSFANMKMELKPIKQQKTM